MIKFLPNTTAVIGMVALAMQFVLVSHVIKLSGLVINAEQCSAMYMDKLQSPL
jgi:ribose/xylose/arabinose/galactoside ABC-type transport system permease subunit